MNENTQLAVGAVIFAAGVGTVIVDYGVKRNKLKKRHAEKMQALDEIKNNLLNMKANRLAQEKIHTQISEGKYAHEADMIADFKAEREFQKIAVRFDR